MANRLALAGATLLAAATMLSACVTEEQLRQESETRCVGYGFKRGTVPFAQCLQNESLAYRQRQAIRDASVNYCSPAGFC
jgi:hypothetical protein